MGSSLPFRREIYNLAGQTPFTAHILKTLSAKTVTSSFSVFVALESRQQKISLISVFHF